ncbi:MAG TPA: ribbon-helix-helix protein, CopG family [Geobacteraceae bacterium]
MPNRKEHPRYHVVSMRISDEEQAALEELTRSNCQSMSNLMRQAMHLYAEANGASNRRQSAG